MVPLFASPASGTVINADGRGENQVTVNLGLTPFPTAVSSFIDAERRFREVWKEPGEKLI